MEKSMKFVIKHEIRGRLHVHLIQKRMTFEEADTLQYYLSTNKYITSVKVYQRTCDVAVTYVGGRAEIIKAFQRFAYSKVDVPDVFIQNSVNEAGPKGLSVKKIARHVYNHNNGFFNVVSFDDLSPE